MYKYLVMGIETLTPTIMSRNYNTLHHYCQVFALQLTARSGLIEIW